MSEESAKEGSIPCFFVHLFAPEKDYRKQLKQVISSYLKNNNANDEDIKKFHRDNLFYVSHSIGQNSFTQARLYELFESSATF